VPAIAETRFEMVQLVFPAHINTQGTLHGGQMMSWIATAGTLAASRFARGPVVLGAMDDLDFLTPVHLGEIVTLGAQVEYVGRASLEIGVEVSSESPRIGVRRKTTSSHLAFIALDEHERPRPVGQTITPGSPQEAIVQAEAGSRKAARVAQARGRDRDADVIPAAPMPGAVVLSRFVRADDALSGTLMFAGKLLGTLDEIAAIASVRHCRGAVVTASMDAVYFHNPLRVAQIVDVQAVLTYVARSSMEIGIRVDSEEPSTGRRHHTCTAFLTMVHVDAKGHPAPVPPLVPTTGAERRLWAAGESRNRERRNRVAQLRAAVGWNVR
jgi:acyl-coenzyme A thioesterase 7